MKTLSCCSQISYLFAKWCIKCSQDNEIQALLSKRKIIEVLMGKNKVVQGQENGVPYALALIPRPGCKLGKEAACGY